MGNSTKKDNRWQLCFALFLLIFIVLTVNPREIFGREAEQLLRENGFKIVNKEVIPFILPDLKGKKISLDDYKGKVILLNFWVTWCPNCVRERYHLKKLRQTLEDDNLVILSVNVREPREKVQKFINIHNLDFPYLVIDEKGVISDKYRIRYFPTNFIINKEGRIISEVFGLREWFEDSIIRIFKYLINQRIGE